MNRIYRYHLNCGRMGDLSGVFAVNDHGEACLRALIESGRSLNYGEVLGKHSDVSAELDDDELKLVEATPDEIAVVLRVLGCGTAGPFATISGFCPLDYATDEDTGDRLDGPALLAWCRGEEGDEDQDDQE